MVPARGDVGRVRRVLRNGWAAPTKSTWVFGSGTGSSTWRRSAVAWPAGHRRSSAHGTPRRSTNCVVRLPAPGSHSGPSPLPSGAGSGSRPLRAACPNHTGESRLLRRKPKTDRGVCGWATASAVDWEGCLIGRSHENPHGMVRFTRQAGRF